MTDTQNTISAALAKVAHLERLQPDENQQHVTLEADVYHDLLALRQAALAHQAPVEAVAWQPIETFDCEDEWTNFMFAWPHSKTDNGWCYDFWCAGHLRKMQKAVADGQAIVAPHLYWVPTHWSKLPNTPVLTPPAQEQIAESANCPTTAQDETLPEFEARQAQECDELLNSTPFGQKRKTTTAQDFCAKNAQKSDGTAQGDLADHFPTGLRQALGSVAGVAVQLPITCECACGEGFTGSDVDEVKQLWAEHVTVLAADQSRDGVIEELPGFTYYKCDDCGFSSTLTGEAKSDICPLCDGDCNRANVMSSRVARVSDKPEGRDDAKAIRALKDSAQ